MDFLPGRELKTKNTRQRHTRWVHGFPSRQLLGLVPFPYSSKPSIVMPRCRGRPLEFTFAQSPVFCRSGPFFVSKKQKTTNNKRHLAVPMEFPPGSFWGWSLFRTVQNQVHTPLSRETLGIYLCTVTSWAGPFSVQFKTKYHAPLSRGTLGIYLCTVTSFSKVWPFFYKETSTTAALWLCRSTLMRTTRISLWSRLTL
jgi:hypothetical protein